MVHYAIEHAKLFNMINSWIIYLRLSSCHYVNKMIIGSSYGIVHRLSFSSSSSFSFLFILGVIVSALLMFSIRSCSYIYSTFRFRWIYFDGRFLIVCYCRHAYFEELDDRSKDGMGLNELSVRFGIVLFALIFNFLHCLHSWNCILLL